MARNESGLTRGLYAGLGHDRFATESKSRPVTRDFVVGGDGFEPPTPAL